MEKTENSLGQAEKPPKLTGARARDAEHALILYVLEDFQVDRPNLNEFREWCEAAAVKYGKKRNDIERIIHAQQIRITAGIGENLRVDARKVARVIGLTQAKAFQVLASAMDANKTIVRFDKETKTHVEYEQPDWDARLRAASETMRLYGSYAPAEINVTHDVGDRLASLTEAELKLKAAELLIQFQNDPRLRGAVPAGLASGLVAASGTQSGPNGAGTPRANPPVNGDSGRAALPSGD